MSKRSSLLLAGAMAPLLLVGGLSGPAVASYRGGPALAEDPVADSTDLYAFRDVADPTVLNIVANFIGLENPSGGPHLVRFADDVRYSIHIDNDGDLVDDIMYSFRFRTTLVNPGTALYNTGQITSPTDPDLSLKQTYSVSKYTRATGTTAVLGTNLQVPPDNVGVRSNPQASYESSTAQPTISTLATGERVFAGPRADPAFQDLGAFTDLRALRPIQNNHVIPLPNSNGVNTLQGLNVHSIVLRLPIAAVTSNGTNPTVVNDKASVIGLHSSAARFATRKLSANGTATNQQPWVQVSRAGLPLMNDLSIPLGKKDRWNSGQPRDDQAAGYLANLLDPELTRQLPSLYPGVFSAQNVPPGGAANRPDLVALITGQLSGLSAANALSPGDLLRLNLASPAGVTGFPNGRRLADDVLDTTVQVFAGVFTDPDHDGKINKLDGTPNPGGVPYSALGDGVNAPDAPLLSNFPYLGTPYNGFTARSCNNPALTCPAP